MKYYLIFFIFILINSSCYDDDSIEAFDKKVCFERELSKDESSQTFMSYGEYPDTCCFVKRTMTVYERDKETIDQDLTHGASHCCYPFPKSKVVDIANFVQTYIEYGDYYEKFKISIDCFAQINKLNLFILI